MKIKILLSLLIIIIGIIVIYFGKDYYKESIEKRELLNLVSEIREKIENKKENIEVYIKNGVAEKDIFTLKERINNTEEVESVDYVSKEQALINFREENKDNPEILQALRELGKNTLYSFFVVWLRDKDDLDKIISYLEEIDSEIIEYYSHGHGYNLILEKIDSIERNIKTNYRKSKIEFEENKKYFTFFDKDVENKSIHDLLTETLKGIE